MSDQASLLPAQPPLTKASEPELRIRFELSSQGIGTLVGALAKARKAFKPVLKTSKNPFFKSNYADLAEVLNSTIDALSDNGIAIIQPPCYRSEEGIVEIHTLMAHSSGEWIKSVLDMVVTKRDAQGEGSAITYGRRYAYSGMVSVASEADDDAQAAVDKSYAEDFDQRTASQRLVDDKQIAAWNSASLKGVRTPAQIEAKFKHHGITCIEDMPKEKFGPALKWLLNPDKGDLVKPMQESLAKPLNLSKLFALGREREWEDEDLKQYCYNRFKIESMTEMTPLQLDEAMAWLNGEGSR